MRKIIAVITPILFMGCLFGTSKLTDYSQTLASVDGRTVTVAQLDSVSKLMMKSTSGELDSDSLKEEALDSLILQRLIDVRVDSVVRELNKDWEFVRKKQKNIGETAKKVLYQERIITAARVDSSEIVEYYEKNKDEFNTPEQVWARHILVRRPEPDTAGITSDKKRQKKIEEADRFARERVEAVLQKALSGDNWDSLAAAYSEDKQNAARGGDLGFFFRGRMVPEFDSAAFSTPAGEIAGPVSTKFGYHIIKVEEYKPAAIRPLDDDVMSQIRGNLAREKEKEIAMAYVDSLKELGTFEYNDTVLNGNDTAYFESDTWVMTVNGTDTLFFETYADVLPRFIKWKQVDSLTVENKMEMLDFLKPNLLLMHAVRQEGFLNHPEVVKAEEDYVTREARLQVSNMMRDLEYEPSDADVESFFYKHIEDYKVERKLMVYHIIFEDSLFAEAIRDSILLGADFVEMAKRYYPGEPEIREVAYNLDYIGPRDMGDVFYNAANELEINGISHPTKTEWGYHLIKLIQRKEDKTINQVKPGIKHTLKNQKDSEKRNLMFKEWKAVADIKINRDLLNRYNPILSGSMN